MHAYLTILVIAAVLVVWIAVQSWMGRHYDFQCEQCGNKFSLSLRAAVLAPHAMGKKWVRCPRCGHRGWAGRVPK